MAEPLWWYQTENTHPGEYIEPVNPHPAVVKIVKDGFTGTPYSPRAQFLKYALAPVLLITFCVLLLLLHAVGLM